MLCEQIWNKNDMGVFSEMKLLNQLVYEFRKALEIIVDKKMYGRLYLFESFPKGCCGYTSDLLATYLIDSGISRERIQLLNSETKEEKYTHSWLMIDNRFFVDITADQFNGKTYFKKYEPIPSCCIVPCNTYLYECFDKEKMEYTSCIGIDSYSGDIPPKLREIYDLVIRQIQNGL